MLAKPINFRHNLRTFGLKTMESQQTAPTCQIPGCKFLTDHVTPGHTCYFCCKFGHGPRQCRNQRLISELAKYNDDIMPETLQCEIAGCPTKHLHKTSGHPCSLCNHAGHTEDACPANLCINCNKPGHLFRLCPSRLCFVVCCHFPMSARLKYTKTYKII